MIYLLLGEETQAKDSFIEKVKKEIFSSIDTLAFDYEILYAFKLNPLDFKKSLLIFPVLAPKRLLIIREVNKLSAHNQQILFEFLQRREDYVDLILDSSSGEENTEFSKKLTAYAKVVNFKKDAKENVFDMTNAIAGADTKEALRVLGRLLSFDIHPLQITGGILWFWRKMRARLSKEKFEKGLIVLQDTDWNIKRSRLDAESALELAIVKLSCLVI